MRNITCPSSDSYEALAVASPGELSTTADLDEKTAADII